MSFRSDIVWTQSKIINSVDGDILWCAMKSLSAQSSFNVLTSLYQFSCVNAGFLCDFKCPRHGRDAYDSCDTWTLADMYPAGSAPKRQLRSPRAPQVALSICIQVQSWALTWLLKRGLNPAFLMWVIDWNCRDEMEAWPPSSHVNMYL